MQQNVLLALWFNIMFGIQIRDDLRKKPSIGFLEFLSDFSYFFFKFMNTYWILTELSSQSDRSSVTYIGPERSPVLYSRIRKVSRSYSEDSVNQGRRIEPRRRRHREPENIIQEETNDNHNYDNNNEAPPVRRMRPIRLRIRPPQIPNPIREGPLDLDSSEGSNSPDEYQSLPSNSYRDEDEVESSPSVGNTSR